MPLVTERYEVQRARWPARGRHILAQFDAASVVVYQAYREALGRYAAEHGRFGGEFSYGRMSWVKPNFLWMMYRSSWGAAEGQEVVLAVRLRREAFDGLLAEAVHSSYVPEVYGTPERWRQRVKEGEVRLQWDPDHAPGGAPLERRALQLGLRGEALRRYGGPWLLGVEDVTALVHAQRAAREGGALETPREEVYPVRDPAVATRLGVDPWP